jgi:hypothetical protein
MNAPLLGEFFQRSHFPLIHAEILTAASSSPYWKTRVNL